MKNQKLIIRNPKLSFENLSKYYYDNNVWATHVLNALHVIVPIGEKFFIRSVKAYANQAKSEKLKSD